MTNADAPTIDLAEITAAHFQPVIGLTLDLVWHAPGQGQQLVERRLPCEVVRLSVKPEATVPGAKREAFSVYLRGPEAPVIMTGLVTLAHPDGPIGPVLVNAVMPMPDDPPGTTYQVVFA